MDLVSIIVPCLNEESTINLLLEAIVQQDYPLEKIEVIIADGLSTDSTRQRIEHFKNDHGELKVRVIDNPNRIIPSGLNLAINEAKGRYIVRLDGHSIPAKDYVSVCIKNLESSKGDNVGGRWDIKARDSGWQAKSIAIAASHPLAVGDAKYRVGGEAQKVDTVPFGAYHKEFIERVGKYDESLLTNEDYELNARIRKNGGVIWFDPAIRSIYLASGSFKALVRQYSRYGFWKAKMLRNNLGTIRWRQALPPLFILSVIILFFLGFWGVYFWLLLGLELLVYFFVLFLTGILIAKKEHDISMILGFPLAVFLMHSSWGGAFLYGMLGSLLSE